MSLIISGKDSVTGQTRFAETGEALIDANGNNILLNQGSMIGRQWGYATAHQTLSTDMDAMMMFRSFNVADNSSGTNTGADGVAFEQNSAIGSNLRWETNSSPRFNVEAEPVLLTKFSLQSLTDVRFFVGMGKDRSDNIFGAGEGTGTDTPGGETYIGLQFSTERGDTNWQFVIDPDGTAQTLVDSGVTASTNVFHLLIELVENQNRVVLLDNRKQLLAAHMFTVSVTSGLIYAGILGAHGTNSNTTTVETYWIEAVQG